MFERFDEGARRVLLLATDEARRLGQCTVGTEHVLLGLLREGNGTASDVLARCGVDADAVRSKLSQEARPPEAAVAAGKPPTFTPAARQALEQGLQEALSLAHQHVACEHLLLGLTSGQGDAGQILVSLGVDLPLLRQQLVERLAHAGAASSGAGTARHRRTLVAPGPGVVAARVPVDPAALITWEDAEEALRELGWRWAATVTPWDDTGLEHRSCVYRPAALPWVTVAVTGAQVTRDAFERTAGERGLPLLDGVGDAAMCDETTGTVTVLQDAVVFAVTVGGHARAATAAIALARKACDRLREAQR